MGASTSKHSQLDRGALAGAAPVVPNTHLSITLPNETVSRVGDPTTPQSSQRRESMYESRGSVQEEESRSSSSSDFSTPGPKLTKAESEEIFLKSPSSILAQTPKVPKPTSAHWPVFELKSGDVQYQQHMTFSLKKIPDHWQRVLPKLRDTDCTDPNFRIISCAHDTLVALKDLYYMTHPEWAEVRDLLQVGLYKETETCGNTSVSMGLAKMYFQRNPNKSVVVFLNCGSGGTRFQIYTKLGRVISVLYEYKPADGMGQGALGDLYIIDDKKEVMYASLKKQASEEALTAEILELMKGAPWKQDDFEAGVQRSLPGIDIEEIRDAVKKENLGVFAFATGSIREEYYRKLSLRDRVGMDLMNASVGRVMKAVNARPFMQIFDEKDDTFFLNEKLEGQMELLALRSMYEQINLKLKDLNGSSENLEPIVGLGVGQTSAQWSCLEHPDETEPHKFFVFAYPHGMNNSARLRGFGKALVGHYDKTVDAMGSLDTLVKVIKMCLAKGKIPVLALKSGAANYLSSRAGNDIRRAFAEDIEVLQDAQAFRVFFAFGSTKRPAIFRRTTSMARLCADAQHLLGSSIDFEGVQVNNRPLRSPAMVKKNDVLYFSGTNENFTWWPDVEHSDLCIKLPLILVADFDAPGTIEMQFQKILRNYFTLNQYTSYDCIAAVTKLLWDDLGGTSARALLDVGEKWFESALKESANEPKHREFMELQNVRAGTFIPKKRFSSAYSEIINFEGVQHALDKNGIKLETFTYQPRAYKASASALEVVPGNSEHTVILKYLQECLGTIHSIDFPLRITEDAFLAVNIVARQAANVFYCINVKLSELKDEQTPLFLSKLGNLHQQIGGFTLNLLNDCTVPVLDFIPIGLEAGTKEAKVNMHDMRRILGAIREGALSVVHCETRIRLENGEGYLPVIVQWQEESKQGQEESKNQQESKVPVFYKIRIRVFSETERFQALIYDLQEANKKAEEEKRKDAQRYRKKNGIKEPIDLDPPNLHEKASTFFRDQSKGFSLALSQGQGDWVLFLRKAQALYLPFNRSLETACSKLQERGLTVEFKANVKSERSLLRKLRSNNELSDHVVPLSALEEKIDYVRNELALTLNGAKLTSDPTKPIRGLSAALATLQALWDIENPKWHKVRGKLKIGFIKETKDYGNTSVSMGAASVTPFTADYIGFLNCGTGGIKYQLYSSRPVLHVEKEAKPRDGCSPNQLAIRKYKPTGASVGLEDAKKLLLQELSNAPWQLYPGTPVFVFITGTIREYWEAESPEGKKEMEETMESLFAGTNFKPLPHTGSFFLSQEEEGKLELLGAQAMYRNLVRAKKLDEATVIGTLGIGQGSSQWIVKNKENFVSYSHPFGMNHAEGLEQLGIKVKEHYADSKNMDALIDMIQSSASPIIALKSGCTLLLEAEEHAAFKEALLSPASFVFDYLRGTYDLPSSGFTPVIFEIEETLRAINNHVGPIVRIKDQSQKGFLIVNVLFWHGVEDKSVIEFTRKASSLPDPTAVAAPVVIHTKALSDPKEPERKTAASSGGTQPKYRNLAMICEVQIRVTGAPDDHIMYEIRRNFGFEAQNKTVQASIMDFFSDTCNFPFCPREPGRKLTLYQDARGQITQAYDKRERTVSDKKK